MYLHSLAARIVIPEPVIQIILLMPTDLFPRQNYSNQTLG